MEGWFIPHLTEKKSENEEIKGYQEEDFYLLSWFRP